jgi:hypothetical protein
MLTLNLLNSFVGFFCRLILNSNRTLQKLPLPMQDEHRNAMEENEWVHESSKRCCKVNACTSSYATKRLFCKHLDQTHGLHMQLGRFGHPSIRPRGFKQQNHISMILWFLSNPHAKQKCNEKKVFDQIKKKAKFKWDEFQTQVQQMQEVQGPLLGYLTFNMLLGIIAILAWGVGFIPQSA